MSRNKIILGVLGLLLVVGGWYSFLWSPAGADLSDAQDREQAAQSQLVVLQAELDGLIAMEINRPRFQSDLEALRSGIPSSPEQAALLTSLYSAADASGVEFLDYNASPPAPAIDSVLGEVQLQIAGTGGYFQLLDFLNRLNDVHRIIVVDRVSISAATSEEAFGPPSLNWQMSARAFTQPSAIEPVTQEVTETTTTGAQG